MTLLVLKNKTSEKCSSEDCFFDTSSLEKYSSAKHISRVIFFNIHYFIPDSFFKDSYIFVFKNWYLLCWNKKYSKEKYGSRDHLFLKPCCTVCAWLFLWFIRSFLFLWIYYTYYYEYLEPILAHETVQIQVFNMLDQIIESMLI